MGELGHQRPPLPKTPLQRAGPVRVIVPGIQVIGSERVAGNRYAPIEVGDKCFPNRLLQQDAQGPVHPAGPELLAGGRGKFQSHPEGRLGNPLRFRQDAELRRQGHLSKTGRVRVAVEENLVTIPEEKAGIVQVLGTFLQNGREQLPFAADVVFIKFLQLVGEAVDVVIQNGQFYPRLKPLQNPVVVLQPERGHFHVHENLKGNGGIDWRSSEAFIDRVELSQFVRIAHVQAEGLLPFRQQLAPLGDELEEKHVERVIHAQRDGSVNIGKRFLQTGARDESREPLDIGSAARPSPVPGFPGGLRL